MKQREGAATFLGNPLTLEGSEVKVGDRIPDITLMKPDLTTYSLSEGMGEARLIASVPSIDTPVCDAEIRRLSEEVAKLDNVRILAVSADLPFAQARWCAAQGLDKVTMLSDHRELAFGKALGISIKELRLLGRAIFVLDPEGRVTHVEYVRELTEHPDYEAAVSALKRAA
ncbi:MAG: thiol peroxidase [Actinomycetota bacterium]|nr:thiol peroxidase [Actinomycetota bacterium]